MAEPVMQWWARRQFSRGSAVPYAVGQYREAWASFPVLVRQYHPDLNAGLTLSQIPPAAEVLLQWQCDSGHVFVATPSEQRMRPGRERRRSSWCPDCAAAANPPRVRPAPLAAVVRDAEAADVGEPAAASAQATGVGGRAASAPASASASARLSPPPPLARRPKPPRRLCSKTPDLPVGTAFASVCAPAPASAVEGRLRTDLAARLEFDATLTAVRVGRPFFDHVEVWPDIVLAELRVAIEYDSTGRHGLEHVGRREAADRRKDRALRGAGWEVVRIRTGRLPELGPFDLVASGITGRTVDDVLDRLREIRGPFLVDAWLR